MSALNPELHLRKSIREQLSRRAIRLSLQHHITGTQYHQLYLKVFQDIMHMQSHTTHIRISDF